MTSAQRFVRHVYPDAGFCPSDYDSDVWNLPEPVRSQRIEELYELSCCDSRARWLADHRKLREQVETLQKRVRELEELTQALSWSLPVTANGTGSVIKPCGCEVYQTCEKCR